MSTDANVLWISATFVLSIYLTLALFHEAIRRARWVAIAASPASAKPAAVAASRRPVTRPRTLAFAGRASIPTAELVALALVVGISLFALKTVTRALVARTKIWMISWGGIVEAVVHDVKTSMACSREGLDYSHFIFWTYLAFDLTLAYINYRQRADYASPWTRRIACTVLSYVVSRVIWTLCRWGPIHLCSITELPTIMLTAARLRPRIATKPILTTIVSLIRLSLLVIFLLPRTLRSLPPLSAPSSVLFFVGLVTHGICIGRHVYYFLEKVTSHPPWSRKAMIEDAFPPSLSMDVHSLITAAAAAASTASPTKLTSHDPDHDRTELQSPPITRPGSPVFLRSPSRSPSTPMIFSQLPPPPLHRRVQDLLPPSSRPNRGIGRGRATFFVDPDEPRGRQRDSKHIAPRYHSGIPERGFLDLQIPMREVLAFYYEPTGGTGEGVPRRTSSSRLGYPENHSVQFMLPS